MSSRVSLASIPALTFYSDELTQSRRTAPIPQLTCIGKPCNLFQPDVVRCVNQGGHGTDVDWKCEADLPESLRFGRVEVSCEGWNRPGDPMVLKGSCGLEYRLVRIPNFQTDGSYISDTSSGGMDPDSALKMIFLALWTIVLLFILYSFLKSCFTRARIPAAARSTPRPTGGGWFPGYRPDDADNPPPYSRHDKPSASSNGEGWRPGFWTGLGLGGIATALWRRQRDSVPTRRSAWDWERTGWGWGSTARQTAPPATPSGGWFRSTETTARRTSTNDRGEGPSNLGSMRRSTGWGGSSVR